MITRKYLTACSCNSTVPSSFSTVFPGADFGGVIFRKACEIKAMSLAILSILPRPTA